MRTSFAALLLCVASVGLAADTLYRYTDDDGNVIFSDRPPPDGRNAETRDLERGISEPVVRIRHEERPEGLRLVASNEFHAPVELMVEFTQVSGYVYPAPERDLRWTLPARASGTLLTLERVTRDAVPRIDYVYEYVAGSPDALHRPPRPYRLPYALASGYRVTQAYPDTATHTTLDSRYAVDFGMPIGTDIFAARDGVVFAVATKNFRGGLDTSRHGASANHVQILHDDGTYAVYAHLNWNSIRVRPGQRVRRGEFIAESGNTGFSTGPHLHFVVLKNSGMQLESVPVSFEGADATGVTPSTGKVMTAY